MTARLGRCCSPHKKFLGAGFRPRDPCLFGFVPLSRTKRVILIFTNLSEPGSIFAGFQWIGRQPLNSKKLFMRIAVLIDTTTHCNILQHTATHCTILQYTAKYCHTLQHTATHCHTLQHTATHCSTLQHTGAHCNTLQQTAT